MPQLTGDAGGGARRGGRQQRGGGVAGEGGGAAHQQELVAPPYDINAVRLQEQDGCCSVNTAIFVFIDG